MATIRKRGDIWYVIYNDSTGKQVWVKGYTDKRETQTLANRLEDEKTKLKRGDTDPQADRLREESAKPIDTHRDAYKAALQAGGNTKNHVGYTIGDITQFIEFSKVKRLDAVTRSMVDQWVLSLIADGHDAISTINRRVGSVKAFLKHLRGIALIDYVLYKYPKLKTKGRERRRRRALEVAEQASLLATNCEGREDIYRFVLGTGARHSACVALTVECVNFSEKTISLKVKDNRHRNRTHVVSMHPGLIPVLTKACEGKTRGDAVFRVPPTRTAAKLLRDDCVRAKIDTTDIDFHALRHTFITTLARANVHPNVVRDLAGHSKVEQTLTYYTHFRRSDERSALELIVL